MYVRLRSLREPRRDAAPRFRRARRREKGIVQRRSGRAQRTRPPENEVPRGM